MVTYGHYFDIKEHYFDAHRRTLKEIKHRKPTPNNVNKNSHGLPPAITSSRATTPPHNISTIPDLHMETTETTRLIPSKNTQKINFLNVYQKSNLFIIVPEQSFQSKKTGKNYSAYREIILNTNYENMMIEANNL